jgi:thiamine kinase-like enzyme
MKTFDLDIRFKNYVVKRLAKLEKFDLQDCKLSVPLSGVKSFVRLLELPNGQGLIIRAFPRANRKQAYKLYLADDLLEKHDVPAPRLVDYSYKFANGKFTFIAEQYIEGKIIGESEINEALIQNLAKLLRTLHGIKSNKWGDIANTKPRRYSNAQLKKVKNRLSGIRRHSLSPIDSKILKKVKNWFAEWKTEIESIEIFDLIHDKLNPGNFMVTNDNKVFLLDFATLQYGYKAKDLAQLYAEVLVDSQEYRKIFEAYYFEGMSATEKQTFQRLYPFYHAYYHLSECAINLKRDREYKTRKMDLRASFHKKFIKNWNELQNIVL